MRYQLLAPICIAIALCAASVSAQTPPRLEGNTLDGRPFQLASLKGKVVLVMFWSTDCAVCRDKMPELRQNYEGWQGKPFELVTVSVDHHRRDLDSYEAILARTVPLRQRFVQLWSGEPGFNDNLRTPQTRLPTLPASYLFDKTGKLVERYEGRIPAEAWDRIADLM